MWVGKCRNQEKISTHCPWNHVTHQKFFYDAGKVLLWWSLRWVNHCLNLLDENDFQNLVTDAQDSGQKKLCQHNKADSLKNDSFYEQ